MASLHQRLDPLTNMKDIVELSMEDTLQYDPYKDDLQNAEMFPILDEGQEATPE